MSEPSDFPIVFMGSDGEPRASTEAIALGYKVSHHSVMQLIGRYRAQISTFGPIAFQMRKGSKLPQGGFGKSTEYALLNERQASFLVSLMRNTKEVVEFKLNMAREFWNLAEALHNRDMTMWERRLRFETKDSKSKAIGSTGATLMNRRKREKPALETERSLIESEMQPPLFASAAHH